MRLLCALALFLGFLVQFAGAQTSPAEALRDRAKKISASELPESYRAVVFGSGEFGGMGVYGLMGFGVGGGSNDQSIMLYSLLGTSFVDPDEFAALLNGKLPRIRSYTLDLTSMIRNTPRNDSGQVPAPIFAESWLEAGRIMQWSPRPDVTRESILKVFGEPGKPNTAADVTRTLSNAKQVALGMIMYSADADDLFPYAHSTSEAQSVVAPYTKNTEVWKSYNPNGGRLLYNTTLSGVSQTSLETPAETPLVWDERPWPDGRRVVGYTDGHAKIATGDEWNAKIWPAELRRREGAKRKSRVTATGSGSLYPRSVSPPPG